MPLRHKYLEPRPDDFDASSSYARRKLLCFNSVPLSVPLSVPMSRANIDSSVLAEASYDHVRSLALLLLPILVFASYTKVDDKTSSLVNTVCINTRGQNNLTKSASRGAHSPVRDHPRGSKVVPLNSWSRVSY